MYKVIPYLQLMRWHRPVGAILLAWPGYWGLILANPNHPSPKLLIVFTLGAWLTRSIGCVLNDFFDREIDGHVTRTKDRPLAQHLIPTHHVFILIILLGLLTLPLLFFLNQATILLALTSVILMVLYPLCKRFFFAPQCVLGLAFSWPALMAFTASINQLPLAAWLLFLASVFWCIGYDTIYAMSDKEEDLALSLHSLPISLGSYDWHGVCLCYGLMMICMMGLGILYSASWLYHAFLLFSFYFPYLWLKEVRKSMDFQKVFRHNQWWGLLIALSLTLL